MLYLFFILCCGSGYSLDCLSGSKSYLSKLFWGIIRSLGVRIVRLVWDEWLLFPVYPNTSERIKSKNRIREEVWLGVELMLGSVISFVFS